MSQSHTLDMIWLAQQAPTLLLAVGAYVGGLITEPLRQAISRLIEKRRLRPGLYIELA